MDKKPFPSSQDGNVYENTSYTVRRFTKRTHNSQTIFIIIIFCFADGVNSLTCFHILPPVFLLQCTHTPSLFCTFCLPVQNSKISIY